jgi:hypothetical protein
MPAGITSSDAMFSVRETPWHGLGAVLDQPPATIAEAIAASGLNWRVEREPIAVDRGDAATVDDWWEPRCEEIPGYQATVRQDTRTVLGIVASGTGSFRTRRRSSSSTSCSARARTSRPPAACTAAVACGSFRPCPSTSRSAATQSARTCC